jgi:hypothetical protein
LWETRRESEAEGGLSCCDRGGAGAAGVTVARLDSAAE